MAIVQPKLSKEELRKRAGQCLELMQSKHRPTREFALAEIKEMPFDEIADLLISSWRADREVMFRVAPINRSPGYIAITAVIPVLLAAAAFYTLTFPWAVAAVLLAMSVIGGRAFVAQRNMWRALFRCKSVRELLNHSQDPRSATVHCDIFRVPVARWSESKLWYSHAASKLTALLPEITPEMSGALDASQREGLRIRLAELSRMRRLSDLQARLGTAMIQYVTNMGDLEAVPAVERIAGLSVSVESEARMIDRARLCLPILQELEQRSRAGKSMLRASEAPAGQSASLLRAVSQHNAADQEVELLRAHDGDSSRV